MLVGSSGREQTGRQQPSSAGLVATHVAPAALGPAVYDYGGSSCSSEVPASAGGHQRLNYNLFDGQGVRGREAKVRNQGQNEVMSQN